VTLCSSSTHPILISHTRASFPAAPVSFSSAARSASSSTTPFHPISGPIRYCYSIPTLSRCLCTPCPSMFAGPSPGTQARHHGRRHLSSPAMLRHCSSSTSPTIVISNSCRPCSTYPSPPKTSPPARTRQADPPAAVGESQGHICEYLSCSKGPGAKTRGPLCKLPCYFIWAK
jgi:hypothetical protein